MTTTAHTTPAHKPTPWWKWLILVLILGGLFYAGWELTRFKPRPAIVNEDGGVVSSPENAFRGVPGTAEDYYY